MPANASYEDAKSSDQKHGHDIIEDEIAIISCGTTKGPIKLKLIRKWSPVGYDRAVILFEKGYYNFSHFFRAVPNFLVQFGISYTPQKQLKKFAESTIKDDPQLDPRIKFDEGTISYAGSGKDSRNSQLFISYGKIPSLGREVWETPIGTVIEGMQNVKNFYGGYGDMPPWGKGPVQQKIRNQGKKYMENNFPLIDNFLTCEVERTNEFKYSTGDFEGVTEKVSSNASDSSKPKLRGLNHALEKKIKGKETEFLTIESSSNNATYPAFMLLFVIFSAISCFLRKTRKGSKTN